MMKVRGFSPPSEQLTEDRTFTLFRSTREKDKKQVIIKMLNKGASSGEAARLAQEYETLRDLELDTALKPVALMEKEQAIVFEDFPGTPLSKHMKKTKADDGKHVLEFLKVAVGITRALGAVHARNVIHKDIKPDSFLVQARSGRVKVVKTRPSPRPKIWKAPPPIFRPNRPDS